MDLSSTTNIKTLKLKPKQQWKMVVKKLVVTTVSSRIVGIRRRMEGMAACSQDETKTHNEQGDERVKGTGGGSQSLIHIDGDVPMCMYKKNKDVELEAKKFEKTRGDGGGRQRYRHVEGDVPMCMRNNGEEKEARSKENEKSSSNRATRDGGSKKTKKDAESEIKGTSSNTVANKTTSEIKHEKYQHCEVAELK